MKSNIYQLKFINKIDVSKTIKITDQFALSLIMTLSLVLLCSRIDNSIVENTQESSTEIKTKNSIENTTKYTQEISRMFIPGKKL